MMHVIHLERDHVFTIFFLLATRFYWLKHKIHEYTVVDTTHFYVVVPT